MHLYVKIYLLLPHFVIPLLPSRVGSGDKKGPMSEHRKIRQFDMSRWKSAALLGLNRLCTDMVQHFTS